MMNLIILLFSATLFANSFFDLSGKWFSSRQDNGNMIEFIKVRDSYHFHSQEKFVDREGRRLYTIDQSVKIEAGSGPVLTGTVDFYDSRGCTFKGLSVVVEFQHLNVANILMTVPRYRHIGCEVVEYIDIPVQLFR